MILAAGRGERMRPLTDSTPKPLLKVGGKALIEYHIQALVRAGVTEIIINYAWLGEQFEQVLGNGKRYGARLSYSPEGAKALETGGGIFRALPMLGEGPFVVVNGDIWTEFSYERLTQVPVDLAHLVLVPNPPHHPKGDFVLDDGKVRDDGETRLTFSGIGVYRSQLFAGCTGGAFQLAPLLRKAMVSRQVSGEKFPGLWFDIGTPQRLEQLDSDLKNRHSAGPAVEL